MAEMLEKASIMYSDRNLLMRLPDARQWMVTSMRARPGMWLRGWPQ